MRNYFVADSWTASHVTVDGASLFASDFRRRALQRCTFSGCQLTPMLRGEVQIDGDSVFWSMFGPYAYLIFLHREMQGGQYKIVLDVHSGAWTGYLMQNWIVEPLLRAGDTIVFPSRFCRDLHLRIFPGMAGNVLVCHPMFDQSAFHDVRDKSEKRVPTRFGILGRLSRDKGTVEAAVSVALFGGKANVPVQLMVVGGEYDTSVDKVRDHFLSIAPEGSRFSYLGSGLTAEELKNKFWNEIDMLLFLSVSNAEALGRVVVEARVHGVDCVMTEFAAARELVDRDARVPVEYLDTKVETDDGIPIATVCVSDVVESMRAVSEKSHGAYTMDESQFLWKTLWDSSAGKHEGRGGEMPYSVRVPGRLDRGEAIECARELAYFFENWQAGNAVLQRSSDDRTNSFLRAVESEVVDFGNLSAYPRELARICGFRAVICGNK